MAHEAITEEGKEGVVFVTLHHGCSGDLAWDELMVGQLGEVAPVFGDLITWQTWAEPLNDISVILSFDINSINLILEEVAVLLLWKLDVLAVLAEVHLDGVFTKLVEELFDGCSLLVGYSADVLVLGHVRAESCVGTEVILGDWVEAIEERFEIGILSFLDDSHDAGSLWLVVSFDEALTDGEGVLLLLVV